MRSSVSQAQLKLRPDAVQQLRSHRPRGGLPPPSRKQQAVQAGIGEFFADLFDFEKWAPRSSQAWRLGQQPEYRNANANANSSAEMTQDDVEVLNERLAVSREREGAVPADPPSTTAASRIELDAEQQPSFLQSTDDEFASALNARITEMVDGGGSSSSAPEEGGGSDSGDRDALTGGMLAGLLIGKYGKAHDVSFVRRDLLGKTLVSLNIYHPHLGQRTFPMSQEDYNEKMDGVALYLEAWGQAERVIQFLKEPVKPRKGLPSRPIVGNAVNIPLELTRDQVVEWFGR